MFAHSSANLSSPIFLLECAVVGHAVLTLEGNGNGMGKGEGEGKRVKVRARVKIRAKTKEKKIENNQRTKMRTTNKGLGREQINKKAAELSQ